MSFVNLTNFFKGIRFRLTLVYSTLFGLFICAFAYIITAQYIDANREDFDSNLYNYALDLSEHVRTSKSRPQIKFEFPEIERQKEFPFSIEKTYFLLRELNGEIILKSEDNLKKEIPFDPHLPRSSRFTHDFLTFEIDNRPYRAVTVKVAFNNNSKMIIQVATPSNTLKESEQRQVLLISLVLPFIIFAAALLSFFIAGQALSPIKVLTETANNIAVKNLSHRVPEVNTGDEVGELAKTLNTLLARLEKSFKAQENFVANASHQLNTPLAIIKGELDVLESKERNIDDFKRFHKSLREELERLIELVKHMLLISRVESGQDTFIFHLLRLDELILSITSRLSHKAREKKITIRFNIADEISPHDMEVNGEKQLLDCLFENLIENAIKYSPTETIVSIDLKKNDSSLVVWISDQGPGISANEIDGLLQNRFQRGSTIGPPGSGIGLPLASQIALHHNSRISYQRLQPKGSLFKVHFPKQNS